MNEIILGRYKISVILGFADCIPSVSFTIMFYLQHLIERLDLIRIIVLFSKNTS